MDVAIAGAGIAGLTTALMLHAVGRHLGGIQPQLFEQSEAPGEAGAGIQISPNGCAVFEQLGLLDDLLDISASPSAIRIVTSNDQRCHAVVPLGTVAKTRYGQPYLTVHRQRLHQLLMTAVQERLGPGSILCDVAVRGVTDGDDRALLLLGNGTTPEFDLIVGADGIHSCVRDAIVPGAAPRFTGHVAWRGVVPRERLAVDSSIADTVTSWIAPGCHAVTYPLGGGHINIVLVEEEREWASESWTVRGDAQHLQTLVENWHPEIRSLVGSMTDVYRWALFDRPVPNQWHGSRVVLVGDSCHAMLPYAAQGAVMAMEDALVLSGSLVDHVRNPTAALADYQRRRIRRVQKVQQMARRHGRLFHQSGLQARLIRLGMRILGTVYPEYFQQRNDWIMGYRVPLPPQ